MSDDFDRNTRVRQLREDGGTIPEIASALDLAMEVVQKICRKFETEAVLSSRSALFLEHIWITDDPDKKWHLNYIFQALRLKTITQNALMFYLESSDIPGVSLRDLMDLAIPDRNHPKPGYLITPLLDICGVGVEGFWSVVGRLTASNLGERFHQEWRKRLAKLSQSSRIGGVRQTWSKPFKPPPWLPRSETFP